MKRNYATITSLIIVLAVLSGCTGTGTPAASVLPTASIAEMQTAAATPSPAPTQSPTPASTPTPTQASTPTPTPQPEVTPTPQPAFAPATALAVKIMKEKKWTAYKYADTVKQALAIALAGSTVYTPEQLAAKLRVKVNKILVSSKTSSQGYNPKSKTVTLSTANATPEALVYYLTTSICGYSEFQSYPNGKIKGISWCFGSNNLRLWIGLVDFISSQNMPEAVVSSAGFYFNDTMVTLQFYQDGNRGVPSEQGLSIPFYYAAGSNEAEKAFFGDKKASDAYKAAFAKRFGAKKLETLITMVDEISQYLGYTAGMSAKQQRNGMAKIKAYEDALLGLLEKRLADLKSQDDLDRFRSDLIQFEKLNIVIDDADYTQNVNKRIAAIWEAVSAKVYS